MPDDTPAPLMLCPSEALQERGTAYVFELLEYGRPVRGFVLRFDGQVRGYLNRCVHVPMEMDWQEGQFFDSAGLYLMCATHGAVYAPDTGLCVGGPCRGAALAKLRIEERDGSVYWLPEPPFFPPEPNESIA